MATRYSTYFDRLWREWAFTVVRRPVWFGDELIDGTFARLIHGLPALAAIVGTVSDVRRTAKRDFLHWVGVWTLILLVALEWPSWIWWWQVFR